MIDVKITFPRSTKNIFGKMHENVKDSLVDALDDGMLLIERVAKTQYLTGPKPRRLEVDSGLLRASVVSMATRSTVPGEIARGRIGVPGVFYAKVHEQGGIPGTGFYIYAKQRGGMHFFWKQRGIWIHHKMRVIIPSRPFLLPAIEQSIDEVRSLLQKAIIRGYHTSVGR